MNRQPILFPCASYDTKAYLLSDRPINECVDKLNKCGNSIINFFALSLKVKRTDGSYNSSKLPLDFFIGRNQRQIVLQSRFISFTLSTDTFFTDLSNIDPKGIFNEVLEAESLKPEDIEKITFELNFTFEGKEQNVATVVSKHKVIPSVVQKMLNLV